MTHETYDLPRWFRVPATILIGLVIGGGGVAVVFYFWRGVSGTTMPDLMLGVFIGAMYAQTINNVWREATTK